jgi:hypothetical protein
MDGPEVFGISLVVFVALCLLSVLICDLVRLVKTRGSK